MLTAVEIPWKIILVIYLFMPVMIRTSLETHVIPTIFFFFFASVLGYDLKTKFSLKWSLCPCQSHSCHWQLNIDSSGSSWGTYSVFFFRYEKLRFPNASFLFPWDLMLLLVSQHLYMYADTYIDIENTHTLTHYNIYKAHV